MHAKKKSKKGFKRPSLELLEELKGDLDALNDMIPGPPRYLELEPDQEKKNRKPKEGEEQTEGGGDAEDEPDGQEFEEIYDGAGGAIDCEDIEFEVDGVLSVINEMREGQDEVKTLSELFESLFGEDTEIVEAVVEFEDAINGYFGWLFGNEAERARDALAKIIEFIKERIEEWKQQSLFPA